MGKRIAAYLCLTAGLAGLALPLLPGIPLLIIGMALLGPNHPIRRTMARWIPRTRKRSKVPEEDDYKH
ncbi:MAG TPA: hypothetical protein VGK64_05080 [Bryobacteraceae bacterium]